MPFKNVILILIKTYPYFVNDPHICKLDLCKINLGTFYCQSFRLVVFRTNHIFMHTG